MTRLARWLPVLFLLLTTLAPAQAQQVFYRPEVTTADIDAGLRTDWYGVYFQGKKIGTFKTSRDRVKDGIRESFQSSMKFFSFGQKAESKITQDLVYDEQAPHALLRGSFEEINGPVPTRFTFTRTAPKTYAFLQTVGAEQRKVTVNDLDYTLGDALASEIWLRKNPALGAEIAARELEVKEQKLDTQSSKVLSVKNTLVNGVDVRYYEVRSKSALYRIESVSRVDSGGTMISGWIAGLFELRLETEAEAKNTEFSRDLFVFGMAKVDRPLGPMRQVKELVLDVTGADAAFEDGPRQTAEKNGDKTRLRTGKRFGKEVKATKEEIDEALSESGTHHINHPKVKELAARAVGDAKTDADKVKNIARFVHDYITPTFTNAMPTIYDLMERRRGDCKSFALLFTNLARASGVPAREVSGLLYVGDDQKAFGGHAWNEVVLDGVWVPIDATFNETEVNATHLCFGTDKQAAKGLLETLGKLSLKVVEVNGAK